METPVFFFFGEMNTLVNMETPAWFFYCTIPGMK